MVMSYKLTTPEKVMAHEFAQIEGDLSQIDQKALKSILPNGMNSHTFLEKIAEGEYLLLTDFPITPLVIAPTDKDNTSDWIVNPDVESFYQPSGLTTLQSRINITRYGSSVSAYNGSLHAAKAFTYIPEPPVDNSEPKNAPLAYEYNIEIAFSTSSPSSPIGLTAELTNTEGKEGQNNWAVAKTEKGSKYTVQTRTKDPKNLRFTVGSGTMELRLKNVKMVTLGSGTVHDAFLPIMPAIQYGERLALTTAGYLYHFKGDQLVQEYKWVGKEGFSPLSSTGAEEPFNHINTALLVYWKIAGEVVTDQYLVYRSKRLTDEEKSDITPDWLEERGVHLDIDTLLGLPSVEVMARDGNTNASPEASTATDTITHIVKTDPSTGLRESVSDIAAAYGLTPARLMQQNAHYANNLSALKVGSNLSITQPNANEKPIAFETFELPPELPSTYNSPQNSHYQYKNGRTSLSNTTPIFPLSPRLVKNGLPLVNIKPERILRIGVFFDGTGNNRENDIYKEENGDHSRTNVARLFEAYPEKTGEQAKIYVSGAGTLDDAWQTPKVIDEGDDMSYASGATGLYDSNGAYVKWQTLLTSLRDTLFDQIQSGDYDAITHIAFDVFGFSRGAALARHFVNALKMGLPDYTQPRGKDTSAVYPNLLASIEEEHYNHNAGYQPDQTRSASVRFVGLFDTVGSFDMPGDNDNNEFQLTLHPEDVGHAFQITAHHEYRINFPLSSLKQKGQLPANFYEEVFPGAHSDVGGGYPFKSQYDKTDLPNFFGSPTNNTYNRELVKIIPISDLRRQYAYKGGIIDWTLHLDRLKAEWQTECLRDYTQRGEAQEENGNLYCYRLQPIDVSLAGLSQERMKQQAERFGIEWFEKEYHLPKEYEGIAEKSVAKAKLWPILSELTLGSITPADWLDKVPENSIHRPHDQVINPGCDGFIDSFVNDIANAEQYKRYEPNAPLKTPTREIYDNG
jgi:hypothetical protein